MNFVSFPTIALFLIPILNLMLYLVVIHPYFPSGIVPHFPSLPLSFMTLTLSKTPGQLYVEWCSVWICAVFSHDCIGVMHFGQEHYRNYLPFSLHHIMKGMRLMYLLAGNVNFDHMVNVVSASFLHLKVINLLFASSCEDAFRLSKYPVSHHTLTPNFSIYVWWFMSAIAIFVVYV